MEKICKNCRYFRTEQGFINYVPHHYCDYINCSEYRQGGKASKEYGINIGLDFDEETGCNCMVYVSPDFGCNRFEPKTIKKELQNV